jgi:hypothetical protein
MHALLVEVDGMSSNVYRYYHRRASTLSVTTTDQQEQPEDGPRRRRRRGPRDSHESAVGRLEQLADVGKSESAQSGLNDYASTGSGPTCQSDARDSQESQPRLVSVACAEARAEGTFLASTDRCSFLSEAVRVTVWGR